MLSVPVYNEKGEQLGSEQIDEALLGGEVNPQLLKQAVVMYHANQRQGTVSLRTRSEVAGASQKLYRQKGTGRARAGNLRTPVRVGGGRAFPKKPREYRKDMPRQMRRLARNQAVLAKIQADSALIVDGLALETPKTKRLAGLLGALKIDRGCVLATAGQDPVLYKSGRNIPRIEIMSVADLNAYAILSRPRLVFTREAFAWFRENVAAVQREVDEAAVAQAVEE